MADQKSFTEAELEKQKKEAADAATKALQEKYDASQVELEKLKGKDMNFEKNREQVKAAEERAKKAEDDILDIKKNTFNGHKDRLVSALAGSDEELKKKIEADIAEKTKSGIPIDPAAIEKLVKDTYISISGQPVNDDVVRSVQSGAGGIRSVAKPKDGEIDPKVKGAAEKFNEHISNKVLKITEDDLKNPKMKVKSSQSQDSAYKPDF